MTPVDGSAACVVLPGRPLDETIAFFRDRLEASGARIGTAELAEG